jgi:hypothetical protein
MESGDAQHELYVQDVLDEIEAEVARSAVSGQVALNSARMAALIERRRRGE